MEGKRKRDESGPSLAISWDGLLHPDFEELARQFPAFGAAWRDVEGRRQAAIEQFQHQQIYATQKRKIPQAVTALETYVTPQFLVYLTRALLHTQFGLSLPALPEDHHLCPPVPNRFFLVDWIQQTLLPHLAGEDYFQEPATTSGLGLDIGTGASCIYPLLYCAAATRRSLQIDRIYATDIDPQAVALAKENVVANRLSSIIVPLVVEPSYRQEPQQTAGQTSGQSSASSTILRGPYQQSLAALQAHGVTSLAFCVTNPPFDDPADTTNNVHPSLSAVRRDGRSRTPLTDTEGWYPGGEVGFLSDIFSDQWQLRAGGTNPLLPGWTASMCGKKTSWQYVVHALQVTLGLSHVATAEFGPGHHVRWFVAWTWEQPALRSPLAASLQWEFDVDVDHASINQETSDDRRILDEVGARIADFCAFKHDWGLQISPAEANKKGVLWHVTEQSPQWRDRIEWLPSSVQRALDGWDATDRAQALLPPEGHFVVDITPVHQAGLAPGTTSRIRIKCHAYAHSMYGKRRVAHIQSIIVGEVGRTNRRWRRKLREAGTQAATNDQAVPMEE